MNVGVTSLWGITFGDGHATGEPLRSVPTGNAENEQETAISEIPKDYLVDF